MPVTISVKRDINRVLKELDGVREGSQKAVRAALNRVVNTASSQSARATVATYNVTLRDIRPFIQPQGASALSGGLTASITFKVRPVPPQLFRPKVRMETVTITRKDGRTFKRKLPVVYLKRYRAGTFRKLPGIFPMHTRKTGVIPAADKIVRRIGAERNKLTKLRFYAMPASFVLGVLVPVVRRVVGERFQLEFRYAYRKFVSGRARLAST